MDWVYDRPNGQVGSTWTLTTTPLKRGQTNTLQGWLPHHYRTTQNNLVFKPYTYLTPRGTMKVAAGNRFQINFTFHGIAPMLPAPQTNSLPNDYVQDWMQTYVQNFANAGHPNGDETYGAGKDLGVTAQYMTFAHQMGLTSVEAQLKTALETRLQDWYTYTRGEAHHFFALYTNWPALIGFDASYGSQAFNDNHFHYGYFMVATALVGLSDPSWFAQYGPMAKLVAKQYANWDRTDTNFPLFRTFDIWEGHSWAGGTSGGGGENQESSSEAMNSWAGIFLMGNALDDDAMTAAGAMGYAMESTAVNEYWEDIYSANFPASYGKSMNGILGGG
jgi:endoglucanase Acf2